MAGLKHDAKACRNKQTSEQIRLGLGLLTSAEKEADAAAQRARDLLKAKKDTKGASLFSEDEA